LSSLSTIAVMFGLITKWGCANGGRAPLAAVMAVDFFKAMPPRDLDAVLDYLQTVPAQD